MISPPPPALADTNKAVAVLPNMTEEALAPALDVALLERLRGMKNADAARQLMQGQTVGMLVARGAEGLMAIKGEPADGGNDIAIPPDVYDDGYGPLALGDQTLEELMQEQIGSDASDAEGTT